MKNLFEFLATNTEVEWVLWDVGEGGILPSSFLTTSYTENASAQVFDPIFFLGLSHHTQSHPGGNNAPSGSQIPLDMPEFRNKGDIGFVNSVNSYIKSVKSSEVQAVKIEVQQMELQLPKFSIFAPDGKYRDYDENTYTDMEIKVNAKRK